MEIRDTQLCDLWPLIADVLSSGGSFRLFPRGISMLPAVRPEKDAVILTAVNAYAVGDILLYKRKDGQFVLHRLMAIRKKGLVFCGDHQMVAESGVSPSQLLARVDAIERDALSGQSCLLSGEDPVYSRYVQRRIRYFPFRSLIGRLSAFVHCISRFLFRHKD